MATYRGTEDVTPGLYLNLRKFNVAAVDKPGALPGTVHDVYRRVPLPLMLAAAPVVGLVYVIFLPFIGFAAVGWLAWNKAAEMANERAKARASLARE